MADTRELEELSRRIAQTLDEARGQDDSGGDVRSKQKRSIMVLQQFYKMLLSDFSPTQWKESKAFLRGAGFPTLRDALKIKPSKLPEKLGKCLERYDGPEERKKQLNAFLSRLEDAVDDLDDAIFASAKLSKKAERALERLEIIGDALETAISLLKRNEIMRAQARSINRLLAGPEGELDTEQEARARHSERISTAEAALATAKERLESSESELALAMERFRKFLSVSGRHLNLIVALLPHIREITAPYVKFDSDELTDWEVSVSIRNFGRFISGLPDGHELTGIDETAAVDALEHLMQNREAIADYNAIRHLQRSIEEQKAEVEKRVSGVREVEKPVVLDMIRAEVAGRAEESRREFQRLMSQVEGSEQQLDEVLGDIGMKEDGTGLPELRTEVDELISLTK